jgi:glycosyltransferase involved in cell wall biosynthesis
MQPVKKKLLLFIDWFDPAYKAGGPIRSSVNFVKQMKSEYEIFVLTSDRDLNDIKPMNSIIADKWIDYVPGVKVFYASARNLRLANIKEQINEIRPDVVYLNSMFSKKFTIYPLWLKRANRISPKIILAPRGMLKNSALDFKRRKKRIFLSMLKWMKIPQLVTFHATDEREKQDVINHFGKDTRVETISNFPGAQDEFSPALEKMKGSLDILFIGRIHPIKGLDILLRVLKQVNQKIRLTVVGNPEDPAYLDVCKKLIQALPDEVTVTFTNEVPHDEVSHLIKQHHIFCLPTKGENFGHAIFESLAAGRPVLISDQTPWRNLKRYKAGWDLSLNDPAKFIEVIEECASMNEEQFNEWCEGAWQFCNSYIEASDTRQQYLKLFS